MKTDKIINLPLDKFITLSLYNKKSGYYIKKNPFGKKSGASLPLSISSGWYPSSF